MQRDLQITPRRLEYTREKEAELFASLMAIANRKQEEMKEMIVETLASMKDQLLEDAANLQFKGQGLPPEPLSIRLPAPPRRKAFAMRACYFPQACY